MGTAARPRRETMAVALSTMPGEPESSGAVLNRPYMPEYSTITTVSRA